MKKIKMNNENTTAGTGSGFEQAHGSHLWAYMLTIKLMVSSKSREKIEFYKEKTTASTSSGFEQAQGHQLWAYMLTIKLMVSSKLTWENKLL
jgi:hypothetical protein